ACPGRSLPRTAFDPSHPHSLPGSTRAGRGTEAFPEDTERMPGAPVAVAQGGRPGATLEPESRMDRPHRESGSREASDSHSETDNPQPPPKPADAVPREHQRWVSVGRGCRRVFGSTSPGRPPLPPPRLARSQPVEPLGTWTRKEVPRKTL